MARKTASTAPPQVVAEVPPAAGSVVLVPPDHVAATKAAMPGYDVRPTEKLPVPVSTVADVRAGLELARDALENLTPEAASQFGPRPSISGLRVKHYRDQVDRLLAVLQGAPAGPSAA